MQRTSIAFVALLALLHTPIAGAASKRISAEDFGESWPFTVQSGILACKNSAVTFTTNGTTYAVNGIAGSRGYADIEPIWEYNWAMLEELGKALNVTAEEALAMAGPVRISIGPIIDVGLKLC